MIISSTIVINQTNRYIKIKVQTIIVILYGSFVSHKLLYFTQKVEEEAFEGQTNRMTGVQIINAYLLDKMEAKKGGFTMIRRKVRFAFVRITYFA